jgi:hypothetical protein
MCSLIMLTGLASAISKATSMSVRETSLSASKQTSDLSKILWRACEFNRRFTEDSRERRVIHSMLCRPPPFFRHSKTSTQDIHALAAPQVFVSSSGYVVL